MTRISIYSWQNKPSHSNKMHFCVKYLPSTQKCFQKRNFLILLIWRGNGIDKAKARGLQKTAITCSNRSCRFGILTYIYSYMTSNYIHTTLGFLSYQEICWGPFQKFRTLPFTCAKAYTLHGANFFKIFTLNLTFCVVQWNWETTINHWHLFKCWRKFNNLFYQRFWTNSFIAKIEGDRHSE